MSLDQRSTRAAPCGEQENHCHPPPPTPGFQHHEQSTKQMGTSDSVEQSGRFSSLHVVPPWNSTGHSGFLLFLKMWEDEANENGGGWVIWLWKGLACCCSENFILVMSRQQFPGAGRGRVLADLWSVWCQEILFHCRL